MQGETTGPGPRIESTEPPKQNGFKQGVLMNLASTFISSNNLVWQMLIQVSVIAGNGSLPHHILGGVLGVAMAAISREGK